MTGSDPYIPLSRLVDHLPIAEGAMLLVSSDVLRLALACHDHGERFDPHLLIDGMKAKLGAEGTLLFPAYTWEFCKTGRFDRRRTPALMGALSSVALKRDDFRRTRHPLYSFAVWGRHQAELCAIDTADGWAPDSPFGVMERMGATNLFIGIDYKDALTFDHFAEATVGVDYRYYKTFTGDYTDEDGVTRPARCTMYVRDLERGVVTAVAPRMDAVLAEAGAYRAFQLNGAPFGVLDVKRTHAVMVEDLRTKGGLIYPRPI